MNFDFEQHCAEESLERYVTGTLGEPAVEQLEEHILICESCRVRLDASDRYVHAMRAGAARIRLEETPARTRTARSFQSLFSTRTSLWGGALAASLAVVTAVSIAIPKHATTADQSIPLSLVAERGESISAPAHRSLDLKLDARGLELGAEARAELVDSSGGVLQQNKLPVRGDRVELRTLRALNAGSYYVRLYSLGTGELAREFALDLQ